MDGKKLFGLATAILVSGVATAQEAPATASESDDNIEELVITGTRVATRTRLDSLAPVDVGPVGCVPVSPVVDPPPVDRL